MKRRFHQAALGGTFDHFHIGHAHLLQTAFSAANKVIIGLTKTEMSHHKPFAKLIQPFTERKQEVLKYLDSSGFRQRAQIIPIHDPVGPAGSDKDIDVLVVSELTKPQAPIVNKARIRNQLKPVPILTAAMIVDESNEYVSSSRIREGIIDRKGRVYLNIFNQDLKVSQALRKKLQLPQGAVISNSTISTHFLQQFSRVCLVGDQVTANFLDSSLPFAYAIVDHRLNREPYTHTKLSSHVFLHRVRVLNPAGSIKASACASILKAVSQASSLIEVNGEEDLLAFPAVLLLPLNSLVLYGQPKKGAVTIKVTEKSKQFFANLLIEDQLVGKKTLY